jgi:hypothetical protein
MVFQALSRASTSRNHAMTDPKHAPAIGDDPDALDLPWDESTELEDEAEDAELSEADAQAAFGRWWGRLPDFIKPTYPFDLPPERMPFAQKVFTIEGAPKHCPVAACQGAQRCLGGGPPCFRADRKDLQQLLFLWWMMLFHGARDEEFAAAPRAKGNLYGLRHEPAKDLCERTRRLRR